ncbi:MAG: hypothetical protein WC356_05455 [Candidatus Micrarchaeia archaeon]|jgi:hypothetical protein
MYFNEIINLNKGILSYKQLLFEILFFSILCIILPSVFVHPQWVVGTLVNAILFRVAITQKGWKFILPIVVLPSIGAIFSGIIFGTPILILFIFAPLIWLGNFSYILINKFCIFKKRLNLGVSLLLSSITKFIILFLSAFIAVYLFNFPDILLTTMGLIQILTAIFGGLLAVSYQELENIYKTY